MKAVSSRGVQERVLLAGTDLVSNFLLAIYSWIKMVKGASGEAGEKVGAKASRGNEC